MGWRIRMENDEGPFCSSIPTTTTKVHCFLHFAQSTLLPRKAYKLYKKGRSLEIVDPAIASSADPEQIVMYIHIGLLCVQSDPQLRPAMDRVVVILSRKPSHLEEPTRPGVPGSRYRRHRTSTRSSRTANSGASSSGSFGTTNTQTATLTGNSSSLTGPRLDPRGKRPVKD